MGARFVFAVITIVLFFSGCGGCLSPVSTGKKSGGQKAEQRAGGIESAQKKLVAIVEKEKKAVRDLTKIVDKNSDEYFSAERKLSEIQAEKEKIQRDIDRLEASVGIGDAVGTAKRGLKWGIEKAKKSAKVGANVGADYLKEKQALPTGEEWLDKRLKGFVEKNALPEVPETIDTPEPERNPETGEKFFWDPEEKKYVALALDGTVSSVAPASPPSPTAEAIEHRGSQVWWWILAGIGGFVIVTVAIAILRRK